jgi:aminoglycoside phosphotransferase (APT) family kinase protein
VDADPVGAPAPEWTAERLVDAAQAAQLVGRQFPQLRGARVELIATGWDNTVYLVDGSWVFRFPRRTIALDGVRREIELLPRLAPALPLPIPVPEFVGAPSESYPWPFWGGRLLPGQELADAELPDAAREPAAAQVGRFLRALHDPGRVIEVGADLPVDPMNRGNPAVRAPIARDWLARLARRNLSPPADIERLLTAAERLGPPAAAPVVVHGDLHIRHLLVDAGQVVGVIDWGDLCLADPAVDLSLSYAALAGPARAALLSAYGPVDAERELRARVLAVFLCAALADYAVAEQRPRLLREAVAGLRRAVAGSPWSADLS